MHSIPLLRCLTCAAAAFLVFPCPTPALSQVRQARIQEAQVRQNPGILPNGRRIPAPDTGTLPNTPASAAGSPAPASAPPQTGAPSAGSPSAAALPPSLLDKPAEPAKVRLADGELSVVATNSSLSAILDSVEAASGMKIDGLGKDQRIFGVYGPGDPRDILSSLLDGAGYNFLMIGDTASGAPGQVILTQRNNTPPGPQQASGQPQSEEEDQPAVYMNNTPPEDANPHPAAAVTPPASSGGVRTPQDILQELERMRAQQSQQQPQ